MKKLAYSKPEISLTTIELHSMLCESNPDNNNRGGDEGPETDPNDEGFGDSHRRDFNTSW